MRTTYAIVMGQVFTALRKRHRMDQNELALEAETSRSTWSRIENGEASLSVDQLLRATKHLATTPASLLSIVEAVKDEAHKSGVSVLDKAAWPPGFDDLSRNSVRTLVERVMQARESAKTPP